MIIKGFEAITGYDEERTIAEMREEGFIDGYIDGFTEGFIEGIFEVLCGLVKDGILDISLAAEKVDMTAEEFEAEIAARETASKAGSVRVRTFDRYRDGWLENEIKKSVFERLCRFVKDGLLDISLAAEKAGMTAGEFEVQMAAMG